MKPLKKSSTVLNCWVFQQSHNKAKVKIQIEGKFFMNIKEKIEKRKAVVGIIGLGYVGLPLAIEFAKGGFRTIGLDIDERKISSLKNKRSYIKHVKVLVQSFKSITHILVNGFSLWSTFQDMVWLIVIVMMNLIQWIIN